VGGDAQEALLIDATLGVELERVHMRPAVARVVKDAQHLHHIADPHGAQRRCAGDGMDAQLAPDFGAALADIHQVVA